MSENNADSNNSTVVRYSRVIGTPWAVALGLSVSVGLGLFTLLGVFAGVDSRSLVSGYLLSALVALPFIATYLERALVVPGRQGVYSLARSSNVLLHRFMTGWLLLGGYAVLVALLGYGVSLYLELLLDRVLDLGISQVKVLTLLVVAVAAPLVLYLAGVRWRWRTLVVVLAAAFVALIALMRMWQSNVVLSSDVVLGVRAGILHVTALIAATYWGILLLVDMRARVRRPLKTLPPSMFTVLIVSSALGTLVGWVLLKTPAALLYRAAPLYGLIVASPAFGQTGLWVLALVSLGLGIVLIAITQVLLSGARLLQSMTEDGFVPASLHFLSTGQAPTGAAVTVGGLLGALLFFLLPPVVLTALASLLLFWVTFMIHIPDVLRSRPSLAPSRRLKLPFHPLVPGIVVVISALASLLLTEGLVYAAGWVAIGLVGYFAYGRAHGVAIRRQQMVVADDEPGAAVGGPRFRVMVCVNNPDTALDLVRFGQRLAHSRNGEVLVLRVKVSPRSLTTQTERQDADEQYRFMAAVLAGLDADGPTPRAIVRLAPTLTSGIMESLREEECDLVLLGGGGRFHRNGAQAENVVNELMSYAPCHVTVMHGAPPREHRRVLVASAGGRHAGYGYELAAQLCGEPDCHLRVITVADNARDDADEVAESALRACMGDAFATAVVVRPPARTPEGEDAAAADTDDTEADSSTTDAGGDVTGNGTGDISENGRVVAEVVHASSVSAGIMDAADEADLLIVGASSTAVRERPVYDGLAVELATASATPTLIVRRKRARRYLELDRAFDRFVDAMPSLSETRRTDVVGDMRQASVPSIDFFVLIVLSAVIASFGLMQNSAAVIIGAMLVAPLMSPILSMAMGMVVGEFDIITSGIEATIKGVVLAIIVGILAVIVSPIDGPTSEILARTEPNLLDLMVALASGAAAGYALSRKEVAAALPGVAIAAALVPPLCVVGYSIGTADLGNAGGALLLFVTNLVAIVFAASITFLLLGFHPPRTERGELFRSLRLTILSLMVILAVLGAATYVSVREGNRRAAVQAVFDDYARRQLAVVSDFEITRQGESFVVDASLLHYDGRRVSGEGYDSLRLDLEEAVGAPVDLRTTMVDAGMLAVNSRSRELNLLAATRRALDAEGATVADSWVESQNDELVVRAVVYMPAGTTLDEATVTAISDDLTERFRRTVLLSLTVLPSHTLGVTPTPLPANDQLR